MYQDIDIQWMRQALALAEKGLYSTTPNPRVGCLIVRDGQVVGQGAHLFAGQPHAEVLALLQARELARGATAYITLEPCNHFGRTGPCTQALIQAGIRSAVVAMQDPNPRVSGAGLQRLRDAGIEVRCGLLQEEARELNCGFISRMTLGRPWVRVKVAASLDGRVALASGQSQWISSSAARVDGHHWRARACLVATGMGTFLKDQPRLTVRDVKTPRAPFRLLLDPQLRADPDALFFNESRAWLATSVDLQAALHAPVVERLLARGVEVLQVPPAVKDARSSAHGRTRHLDLSDLLRQLAGREINEMQLEAGPGLVGAFLAQDLVDEWLIYLAPVLLGEGPGIAHPVGPWASPEEAPRWRLVESTSVGDGLRLRLLR